MLQKLDGFKKIIEELSYEIIEAIINTLPVEISFVDKNDIVRYFNKEGRRMFPRSRAVIGRKVQDWHPKKSVKVVNKILDDFRNKKRNCAKFWINLKRRKIYIRYFAVRDTEGSYLRCLEVTQDITDIQKIKGKRNS